MEAEEFQQEMLKYKFRIINITIERAINEPIQNCIMF